MAAAAVQQCPAVLSVPPVLGSSPGSVVRVGSGRTDVPGCTDSVADWPVNYSAVGSARRNAVAAH